ncbi:MAG: DEAD/DEAH box helicase [Candidatus Aenigmarchaeota archaeon]|nr:DEAD/DEAH box helicase [Candidatus Aenigmarchaeota archaeon]
MRLSELPFPANVLQSLQAGGVEHLNPPQEDAVKQGLLDGRNLVVASPTASGKTLIAELALLKHFLANGKIIYLVPLKALGSEKYRDFKEKYEQLGMRIALSVGDLDSSDGWLQRYDVIVASNEKMDSLLRHNADWLSRISLIIADEVHLLNDASRGPTLEVVLTRLRKLCNAQLLALSATIRNADEIAAWLGAGLVRSDYRPVQLHYGTSYPNGKAHVIDYAEKESLVISGDKESEAAIAKDTVQRKKQALFFVSTRRNAEALAERLAASTVALLSTTERALLQKIAKDVENALHVPTKQCKRLAASVAGGTAFHHAGLVAQQRKLIEDHFRAGTIKILTATSTLAFGLNLPAWRVLIRDTKRYGGYGADYIPVLEVQQMAGRAGRPKYDNEGEAILVAKAKAEAEELKARYIFGEPEPIYSKLSVEPMLRMHVLALIASEAVKTKNGLQEFLAQTFFAHQYGDIEEVMEKVERILKELESYAFIAAGQGKFISSEFVPAFEIGKDVHLAATTLGKRVSELYLDPRSAHFIITNKPQSDIEHLLVVSQCLEMRPLVRVKQKEYDAIENKLADTGITYPDVWDVDYEDFLDAFKTSLVFSDWIDEKNEHALLETYGITPGELYAKTTSAEWLLYSAKELAALAAKKSEANHANRLRLRMQHGVKEELLHLVQIRGIGRVRARMLYKAGVTNAADIRNAPAEKLAALLGARLALQLKEDSAASLEEKMKRVKRSYRYDD